MNTLRKAAYLLNRREKRQAVLVLILSLLKSIADTVTIGAVMPFLAIVVDTSLIRSNEILKYFFELSGMESERGFTLLLGCLILIMLLLSTIIRVAATYAIARFSHFRSYSISRKLLRAYIDQPYAFFFTEDPEKLKSNILAESQRMATQIYRPIAEIASSACLLLFLSILLLVASPGPIAVALVVMGAIYGGIYTLSRSIISRAGKRIVENTKLAFRFAAEAIAGIKIVKIGQLEALYDARFSAPAQKRAADLTLNQTLRQSPKFVIELFAFGGLITAGLVLIAQTEGSMRDSLTNTIPLLGLYAFAGYRVLPSIQSIFSYAALFRLGIPSLDAIYADLKACSENRPPKHVAGNRIGFEKSLRLDNVSYAYPESELRSLDGFNCEIKQGQLVGITGPSGAGKSTLVDLILGVISPDGGELSIDGVPITDATRSSWSKSIAYVPQEIFLIDATIAENIAFGQEVADIDDKRLHAAVRLANLTDFIESDLPDGVQTRVGDKGIRLSGGQRQRIGIARALYRESDLLVLDEATSALDNLTERAVMQDIHALSGDRTIIIVAHRLSTIRNCDRILLLEDGRLVGDADFETLKATNATFKALLLDEDD